MLYRQSTQPDVSCHHLTETAPPDGMRMGTNSECSCES